MLLAATAWALAWLATGSIDAADWLPYAVLAALLVLVVAVSGGARRPGGAELGALAALVALAGWEAISISWSAVPSLARDEALLTLFYAAVFLLPLLTLTRPSDRLLASAAVAVSAGALALGAALVLRFDHQADHFYWGRRLSFPISYPNAVAAVFLIGFWPAVVLSAGRQRNVLVRSCSLAGATAIAAASLTAQSKGSIAAMTVSCALLFALSPLRLRLLVPTVAALGLTAIAYRPLTEPFRSGERRRHPPRGHYDRRADRDRRRGRTPLRRGRPAAGLRPTCARSRSPHGGRARRLGCRGLYRGFLHTGLPLRLVRRPVAIVQERASGRRGVEPPAAARVVPLRLLARRAGRVQGASTRRDRLAWFRAGVPPASPRPGDAGPGALGRAGRAQRARHRRARAAVVRALPAADPHRLARART